MLNADGTLATANYAVYQNPNTRKYYVFEKDLETGETKFFPVFSIQSTHWQSLEWKSDKKNRAYKTMCLKPIKLKNGYTALVPYDGKNEHQSKPEKIVIHENADAVSADDLPF